MTTCIPCSETGRARRGSHRRSGRRRPDLARNYVCLNWASEECKSVLRLLSRVDAGLSLLSAPSSLGHTRATLRPRLDCTSSTHREGYEALVRGKECTWLEVSVAYSATVLYLPHRVLRSKLNFLYTASTSGLTPHPSAFATTIDELHAPTYAQALTNTSNPEHSY